MYSRYRQKIYEQEQAKFKKRLIPRIEPRQYPIVFFILLMLVAIPMTKYVMLRNSYERSRAYDPSHQDKAKGMNFDGLEVDETGKCKHAYKLAGLPNGKELCTHGPDLAPDGFDINTSVAPRKGPTSLLQTKSNVLGVTCDGNGTDGNRIQVLYVRSSDKVDRYDQYASSFQAYLANANYTDTGDTGVDYSFSNSAKETGGDRHVRFVTDSGCNPIVERVELTPTGDDTFNNTVSELMAKGYDRTDRNYVIFMDANVYCGISDIQFDDTPGATNLNNLGPHYSRVDSGCWAGLTTAHEIAHALGAVQMTAPHSSFDWHCVDQADLMCRPTNGTPQQQICSPTGFQRFDCNHDDYYSTNPLSGSYLASHWNVANSKFLIGATDYVVPATPTPTPLPTATPTPTPVPAEMKANQLQSGVKKAKVFSASTTFTKGQSVVVQAHVVDGSGKNVSGASVGLTVRRPTDLAQCTLSATTDTTGTVSFSCTIPKTGPTGQWHIKIETLQKNNYFVGSGSVTDAYFSVN